MSTTTPVETDHSPAPAQASPAAIFRFQTWLHAGPGSEACEEVDEFTGENTCADLSHFHAWLRLPNSLQVAQIRERALAAKARKLRQMRAPDSDAAAILDAEIDDLLRQEDGHARIVEELLNADFWKHYNEAALDVAQIDADGPPPEDGEPEKKYAHIGDDQARFMRLSRLPEEERPADEFKELTDHLTSYQADVRTALEAIVEPKRQALMDQDVSTLADALRDRRIAAEADAEFSRVYDQHQWLSCSFRQPNGRNSFSSLAELESAPGEVIDALEAAFIDLARTAREGAGN